MLAGVPVQAVLARLRSVRQGARVGKRTHGTNVGELLRLLRPHGLTLGRRMRHDPLPSPGLVVLRIERGPGRNWHWAVCQDGWVYDPSERETYPFTALTQFSWYAVEQQ